MKEEEKNKNFSNQIGVRKNYLNPHFKCRQLKKIKKKRQRQ